MKKTEKTAKDGTKDAGFTPATEILTRNEARQALESGYIAPTVAALLLGFGMDEAILDPLIESGAIKLRSVVDVNDLVRVTGRTLGELLDEHWPTSGATKQVGLVQ